MGAYLPCFKAYDVRGKVPSELNPKIARAIGRAYAEETGAKKVCVGYDIRLSGPALSIALTEGLKEGGAEGIDLGLVGTEMVYFATAHYGYDGGVMITASHNPPEYNGMKMVRRESRPISSDSGLDAIEKRAFDFLSACPDPAEERASPEFELKASLYDDFVQHLLRLIPIKTARPLHVLANAGNGAAGLAIDALELNLAMQIEKMHFEPDGSFPNGVPNPILAESRAEMERNMQASPGKYDFGVAWDGDYDRCFFLDENGRFIEGYYIVGLLAQAILSQTKGQTIVYDPRLYWNTLDIVNRLGGKAVVCKSGHAFIKEKMRSVDAIYGGEMSAHHYFRDHWYCDSGMIPFLMIARLIDTEGRSLGQLVDEMIRAYPCSGEVNSEVDDVASTLQRVEREYSTGIIDRLDGLSIEFEDWRFNLRGSNTEPVIRLNVETRGNENLMREKTHDLLAIIRAQ